MPDVQLTWDPTLGDFDRWDENGNRPDLPPGAAQWRRDEGGEIRGIMYACPCGCADWRSIGVRVGDAGGPAHAWSWDGNETVPTLSPSIKHVPPPRGGCTWHGFLQAGVWRGDRED